MSQEQNIKPVATLPTPPVQINTTSQSTQPIVVSSVAEQSVDLRAGYGGGVMLYRTVCNASEDGFPLHFSTKADLAMAANEVKQEQ
jgi:hypothetical protein